MTTFSLLYHQFFILHMGYEKEMTPVTFFMAMFLVIAFFIACLVGNIVFLFIVNLNAKLDFSNQEHIKLLNGMHEGLIILNEEFKKENGGQTVMFCNKPAKKLLTNFIGKLDEPG